MGLRREKGIGEAGAGCFRAIRSRSVRVHGAIASFYGIFRGLIGRLAARSRVCAKSIG